MLCTQHTNILFRELVKYALYKTIYSAFRHPYITGMSSEEFKLLDSDYLDEQLNKIKTYYKN